MPCPPGYKCVNQFCVPQRCQGVTCPSGERATRTPVQCVDLCAGVTCANPKTCVGGRCIDCNDPLLACTSPQICIAGMCKDDPCLNKNCPTGQYCDAGTCKDLCTPGKCADSERCVAGSCQTDPCAGVPCPMGQFCNPLTVKCETDRCPATQCGAGMACVPMTNSCKADPCQTIHCPDDCWSCIVTPDGIGTCIVDNVKCQPVNIVVGQKGGGNAAAAARSAAAARRPAGLLAWPDRRRRALAVPLVPLARRGRGVKLHADRLARVPDALSGCGVNENGTGRSRRDQHDLERPPAEHAREAPCACRWSACGRVVPAQRNRRGTRRVS
jgi:hypothetical protein